ncbi:MAG: hypothetical protein AUI14_18765 [Actinobacteria bacterium 13_2_20CM_2_71_6]|nr:MAG: hypothetical protein AUI14_18765 [Actinobacteria bacterium 13_2_20CM_2_71_6]
MRRLLLALYPKAWRERFGAEFAALLEDTPLSVFVVTDTVRQALRLRVGAHRWVPAWLGALALFGFFDWASAASGYTHNILWAPSDPRRALALAVTVAPLAIVAALAAVGRVRRRRA